MVITKYFKVNDDELEELKVKRFKHDFSIVVECGLDFSGDIMSIYHENKNKCNNCCNECELCKVSYKESPRSIKGIYSIKPSMTNDISSIINEMKMNLPIEKDLYIETTTLRNRIKEIMDYRESLINTEDCSLIDYCAVNRIQEKLQHIHFRMLVLEKCYRKYRETNDENDNNLYLIHLGLAVEYVHDVLEFVRNERPKVKEYVEAITKARERIE